ncbi:MAG TPA: hypothetical protein PK760_13120, partial [Flavobacteriales bacterium]|nr:hypothetical protein [Flavobacteriales bacterium]
MRTPRHLLLLSVVFLSTWVSAQFTGDFNDNDFTSGTVWNGSTALFTASTGQLQSQSPGADNYYLSTPSTLVDDAQWEYSIDLRFATSGANY